MHVYTDTLSVSAIIGIESPKLNCLACASSNQFFVHFDLSLTQPYIKSGPRRRTLSIARVPRAHAYVHTQYIDIIATLTCAFSLCLGSAREALFPAVPISSSCAVSTSPSHYAVVSFGFKEGNYSGSIALLGFLQHNGAITHRIPQPQQGQRCVAPPSPHILHGFDVERQELHICLRRGVLVGAGN